MKKRFLLVFFFNLISQIVFSGVKPEHDTWFEQIIVGGNLIENHSEYIDYKKNQKTTYFFQTPEIIKNLKTVAPEEYEKIRLIEDALTIAIDQNNGNNHKLYEDLKRRLNNPKLTPPFEKINFTTLWWNHETPTHMGWDKWRNSPPFQARKKLLEGVTQKIFPTADKNIQNELCRFFCAVHVLGDIFGNIAPKSNNSKAIGEEKGSQVASDTRMNIEELIKELRICLPVIINDSEDILLDLEVINKKGKMLLGGVPLKKIDEQKYFSYIRLAGYKENSYRLGFITYKSITEENCETIQNLLYSKFPKLISEMDFFRDSFPELSKLINKL